MTFSASLWETKETTGIKALEFIKKTKLSILKTVRDGFWEMKH